jgi:hypothetical protein
MILEEFGSREGKMDLRDISSLMASQQAIKMNNNHELIDMVIKTEKLQIF